MISSEVFFNYLKKCRREIMECGYVENINVDCCIFMYLV